jgi:DNA invertase Pin-like site-specific DNA recombinase
MQERGITLISVTEHDLGSTDPTRIMFRQILGAIHQYEKSMIVLKLRGARQRMKVRTGRCEGRKPFGSRPGEDMVLNRIRELRSAGLGFDRIAEILNAEGCRPRSGKQWHGNVLNRILTRVETTR